MSCIRSVVVPVVLLTLTLVGCGGPEYSDELSVAEESVRGGRWGKGGPGNTGADAGVDAGTPSQPTEPEPQPTEPVDAGTTPSEPVDAGTTPPSRWIPAQGTPWQWQLTGALDTTVNVPVYDVDGDDATAAQVAALHAAGKKVICYLSAGTWENWRADANDFPTSILGKTVGGWPDEKWLDIRALDSPLGPTGKSLRQIIEARMDKCKAKGFDAIEPDNIDGYTNSNGFGLTAANQLAYNTFLANAAHARGLSIGLKNDKEQTAALVSVFDFGIDEECQVWNECVGPGTANNPGWTPFISAGKAVFHAEYTDQVSSCTQPAGFSSILKHRDLDAWRGLCSP